MTRRSFLYIFVIAPGLLLTSAVIPALAAGKRKPSKNPPQKPLDVNKATAEELEQVPGIGPVTARAIVNYRVKNGPFRRLEELMIIDGISEQKLEKLRPWLVVK